MTRLYYVRRARKPRPAHGIRKGQPYYWWKFARCPKQYSLTKPPRSAYLTRSPFLRRMMDLEDSFDGIDCGDPDGVITAVQTAVDELDELHEELESTLSNVMEKFPNGCPTAELLETRRDQVQEIRDQLDSASGQLSEDSTREEVEAALNGINWEYE